jgi:hypothetical protein
MQIKSTKDYDIFKFINSNREVDHAHVQKIKDSIQQKDLLSVHPINVNAKMEVIDGQHRLQAAKELGVPIFYLVNEGISSHDISRLNSIKKNWCLEDYLNHYMVEGLPEYKKVGQFVRHYSKIPLSGAIQILGGNYAGLLRDFRDGRFEVSDYEQATKIGQELYAIKDIPTQIGKHLFSSAFLRVYLSAREHEKFEFAKFIKQIEKQPRSFVPCVNNKQYLEMFNEFYNKDIRQENKVLFTVKK